VLWEKWDSSTRVYMYARSVLQCGSECRSALQRVVARCRVLQHAPVLQCVVLCCVVLQCVAVRCSALQRVAVCCNYEDAYDG